MLSLSFLADPDQCFSDGLVEHRQSRRTYDLQRDRSGIKAGQVRRDVEAEACLPQGRSCSRSHSANGRRQCGAEAIVRT